MAFSFFDQPVLNSPYEPPTRHHALDPDGQPLDRPPVAGRRRSELITPVPKARKKQGRSSQGSLRLSDAQGLSTEDQEYNPTPIINEIRGLHRLAGARCSTRADWGVTPVDATAADNTGGATAIGTEPRPFFCQVEAVETVDLADRGRLRPAIAIRARQVIRQHLQGANEQANPDLFAHRAEDGDRQRQDDRHGHADRVADRQRRAHAGQRATSAVASCSSRPASPSRIACASCSPTIPTATIGSRELVPADMLPGHRPKPRSSSPTTTRSSGGRRWRSARSGARCCKAAMRRPTRSRTEGQMLQRVAKRPARRSRTSSC